MVEHDEIVTSDLSQFGRADINEAKRLLSAYLFDNETKMLNDYGIQIYMNKHSGMVFLSDEDYNVAVVVETKEHGDILIDWIVCPECGYEENQHDFQWMAEQDTEYTEECCKEHWQELKEYYYKEIKNE